MRAEVWSAHTLRRLLSAACHAERALPDARRQEHGAEDGSGARTVASSPVETRVLLQSSKGRAGYGRSTNSDAPSSRAIGTEVTGAHRKSSVGEGGAEKRDCEPIYTRPAMILSDSVSGNTLTV